MRSSQSVRFAVLGVVARHPEGIHGYRLKCQCDGSGNASCSATVAPAVQVVSASATFPCSYCACPRDSMANTFRGGFRWIVASFWS